MWNTHSKPTNNNTHTLSCTPRAAATMTAGRFGAWLAATPQGGLALGVSSSGSSHHSALDTDQSHKSILARA